MRTLSLLALLGVGCGGSSASQDAPGPGDGSSGPAAANFSFFITSSGSATGGDFRRSPADSDGLAGADEFCRTKAVAAVPASAARQWRAYLSPDAVNPKDRIGAGPWFNYRGVMVAASVAALHEPTSNMINKPNGLDETGATVPGRGDTPNQHDILTGSTATGMSTATTAPTGPAPPRPARPPRSATSTAWAAAPI